MRNTRWFLTFLTINNQQVKKKSTTSFTCTDAVFSHPGMIILEKYEKFYSPDLLLVQLIINNCLKPFEFNKKRKNKSRSTKIIKTPTKTRWQLKNWSTITCPHYAVLKSQVKIVSIITFELYGGGYLKIYCTTKLWFMIYVVYNFIDFLCLLFCYENAMHI